MAKYVSRITYKGKEMLFMNARGVNEEEAIAAWEEMRQEILKKQNTRLTLIDGTDIAITPAILRKAKEASSGEANPDSRAVFVGMSPIQRSTAELIARGHAPERALLQYAGRGQGMAGQGGQQAPEERLTPEEEQQAGFLRLDRLLSGHAMQATTPSIARSTCTIWRPP